MTDTVDILATLAAIGVPLKAIIDAVRRQYPTLEGLAVQGLAALLGFGAAAGLDLRATEALLELGGITAGRVPVPFVDYLITGIAIAATAGLFAELTGRSGGGPTVIEVDAEGNPV